MLNNFHEDLIQQLAEEQRVIDDQAFPRELSELLLQDFEKLHHEGLFRPASIGRGNSLQVQQQIRGDETLWLDEKSLTPTQSLFFKWMHELRESLNQNFFIGAQEIEAHYALYPEGGGYDKHIDQHAGTSHRKVTFILYLNADWQPNDGGELLIFDPQQPTRLLEIVQPRMGRLVLFRSEVFPHQVAKAQRVRKSLTGWIRS